MRNTEDLFVEVEELFRASPSNKTSILLNWQWIAKLAVSAYREPQYEKFSFNFSVFFFFVCGLGQAIGHSLLQDRTRNSLHFTSSALFKQLLYRVAQKS